MVTIREWYERANAVWPSDLPELTMPEALRAARKLWRYAAGSRHWQWDAIRPVYRKTQYTWIRRGILFVNHNKIEWIPGQGRAIGGWRTFVHDLGHCIDYHTGERRKAGRPHSKQHARLEIRLAKQVIQRGWLEGKLSD